MCVLDSLIYRTYLWKTEKKKQWFYKPGSVHNKMHKSICMQVIAACHLSTIGVTTNLYRSTLQLRRTAFSNLRPQGCRNSAGIRELSTSGVHSTHVAIRLVGSCPTFSPLPA